MSETVNLVISCSDVVAAMTWVFSGEKNASGHAVLHYKVCTIQTTMDTKGSGASEMSVSFPDSPVRIPGKEWKGISAPELAIASWF